MDRLDKQESRSKRRIWQIRCNNELSKEELTCEANRGKESQRILLTDLYMQINRLEDYGG